MVIEDIHRTLTLHISLDQQRKLGVRWDHNGSDDTSGRTLDPDAAWSFKTGKFGKRQPYYGYELHALARVPDEDQTAADLPVLVAGIDLTRPTSTWSSRPWGSSTGSPPAAHNTRHVSVSCDSVGR